MNTGGVIKPIFDQKILSDIESVIREVSEEVCNSYFKRINSIYYRWESYAFFILFISKILPW